MYDSGDYAVQQIAAEFGVTRPTIYCPERARADFQDRLTRCGAAWSAPWTNGSPQRAGRISAAELAGTDRAGVAASGRGRS